MMRLKKLTVEPMIDVNAIG
ncbi:Protein of unknown function [Escherichia coli D6-113.11]|nr:Protein of unknown function [Escherichia coli D6-113.11]CDU32689.1 Protein of unknown function [Escherichia coli D6-113.11]